MIKTKNKCCHDSILFCNSKSQYLHIRFSDPALLLVFWYSPLDSSEVAFCLPRLISYNEACSRFAIVSLGNTGPFLTSKVSKDMIMTDLSIFRNTKNQMFISLAGFYLNRARFRVRFHTRGSWFESWNYSQFFDKVFVINCEKHKCFVIMAYRLCTEGNIREIRIIVWLYNILNHLLPF